MSYLLSIAAWVAANVDCDEVWSRRKHLITSHSIALKSILTAIVLHTSLTLSLPTRAISRPLSPNTQLWPIETWSFSHDEWMIGMQCSQHNSCMHMASLTGPSLLLLRTRKVSIVFRKKIKYQLGQFKYQIRKYIYIYVFFLLFRRFYFIENDRSHQVKSTRVAIDGSERFQRTGKMQYRYGKWGEIFTFVQHVPPSASSSSLLLRLQFFLIFHFLCAGCRCPVYVACSFSLEQRLSYTRKAYILVNQPTFSKHAVDWIPRNENYQNQRENISCHNHCEREGARERPSESTLKINLASRDILIRCFAFVRAYLIQPGRGMWGELWISLDSERMWSL